MLHFIGPCHRNPLQKLSFASFKYEVDLVTKTNYKQIGLKMWLKSSEGWKEDVEPITKHGISGGTVAWGTTKPCLLTEYTHMQKFYFLKRVIFTSDCKRTSVSLDCKRDVCVVRGFFFCLFQLNKRIFITN